MCLIKHLPKQLRNRISWPSGSPSRLFQEEEVQSPPDAGRPKLKKVSAQIGGATVSQAAPGEFLSPPGGPVQNFNPSLSGDPGIPRPPTREELISLLKGCDAFSGPRNHCSKK
ncbi:hypothetical protein [Desulforamulus reducens]|uniref:hypothetical protein n=1 Tax=Desulforamulus reducens TaxID=59610 RepID=UPI00059BCFD2|nr:hypothetical protein [Desulforamulus reducens]